MADEPKKTNKGISKTRYYFPNREYFETLETEMGKNAPPCVVFTPRALPFNPFIVAGSVDLENIENAIAGIARIAKMALTGSGRKGVRDRMIYITPKDLSSGGLSLPNASDMKNGKGEITGVTFSDNRKNEAPGYLSVSDNKDNVDTKPIQLIFPLKPIICGLTQEWSSETDVIPGALNAIGQALATTVSSKISDFLGSGDALKIAQANGGAYTFSVTRKTYQGANPQQFTFDFEFVPRNRQEAKEILEITNIFRFLSMAQSPSGHENASIQIGRMPAIWSIQYYGIPDDMLKKGNVYEFMVCTGVNVTYGDGEFYSGFKFGTKSELFPNLIKLNFTMDEFFSNHSAEDYYGALNTDVTS